MFGRKGLVLFFFCSFGVFFIKPVFAGDILDGPILERAFRSEIRALFDDEDFASLESVADDLRRTKARFPSGTWKLAHFYDALNSPDVPNLPAWEELGIRIHRWTQSFPKSVTAQVAMGNFWLAFAWDARGNGSAATITEEGGRLWRERLEKAYHILRAGPVSPGADCPGRIASCLELGKAMGWNRLTFDAMFEQGVLLEPGYESYYLIKAAYLMPRWYGRPGEWQKFADKATSLTPPSEGEAIYARIAWATSRYYQSDFFGSEVGVSWGRMKQGFIDMEKRFAGSRWNLNHFCKFACLAGDRETASSLFERIGENPYIEAWESYGIFEKWRKWAIPFPGKRGGERVVPSAANQFAGKETVGQKIEVKWGENLLINPDAQRGRLGWEMRPGADIERLENGDVCFSIRNGGSLSQAVQIPEVSGGYAVLVGRFLTERINSDGGITGLPHISGHLLVDGNKIQSTFNGQKLSFNTVKANKWEPAFGVFPIKTPVTKVNMVLSQLESRGVPQNGSAVLFDDLGVYLFKNEEDAFRFAIDFNMKYKESGS